MKREKMWNYKHVLFVGGQSVIIKSWRRNQLQRWHARKITATQPVKKNSMLKEPTGINSVWPQKGWLHGWMLMSSSIRASGKNENTVCENTRFNCPQDKSEDHFQQRNNLVPSLMFWVRVYETTAHLSLLYSWRLNQFWIKSQECKSCEHQTNCLMIEWCSIHSVSHTSSQWDE